MNFYIKIDKSNISNKKELFTNYGCFIKNEVSEMFLKSPKMTIYNIRNKKCQ